MRLRDIDYQEDYRSGYDDIVNDFFRPSLSRAKEYWRAVGYFSSTALESFGAPLGEFVKNGGHIRLVTSVALSQRDLDAIRNGTSKQEVCARRLERIIDADFAEGVGDGTVRLVRLLELGRLEIQIAVPRTGTGIYHEKIGLFMDGQDWVAFTGSSNESRNAFENNRECVDVYPSWTSGARAARKRAHFEELWKGEDRGVTVYSFPDAARKKLITVCDSGTASGGTIRDGLPDGPDTTWDPVDKWSHQDDALEKFLAAHHGVLNMATGTGKTRTALEIAAALYDRNDIDTVIVSTDGNDLLDQWHGEMLGRRKQFRFNIYCHYRSQHEVKDFLLEPNNRVLLVSRQPLARALRHLTAEEASRTLLVHDEVHGLGSTANRERLNGLSDNIRFRLGLSATPEREYDEEGNEFIENNIGPEIFRFGLKDAIRKKILVPFRYFPLAYHLTSTDKQRIANVYKRKAARAAAGDPMTDKEIWIDIAHVYKTSLAKLPVFDEFIQQRQNLLKRCIIFVETKEYGYAVLEIVHKYRADFHTYFSGEESETLKRFARGELKCLVTCHRVSEGIDIRSLDSVILFSSARARLETIQRMGRCLRTNPKTPDKVANVVDFVRHSEQDEKENADNERAEWLASLSRVRAEESMNGA